MIGFILSFVFYYVIVKLIDMKFNTNFNIRGGNLYFTYKWNSIQKEVKIV